MKYILIILILNSNVLLSQVKTPDRITISSNWPFKKNSKKHIDSLRIDFKNYKAFDLKKGVTFSKVKENKKWTFHDSIIPPIFIDTNTFVKLDSAFNNVNSFKSNGGKSFFFKIELLYLSGSKDTELPIQKKEIQFIYSMSGMPEPEIPLIIKKILDAYFKNVP